MYLDFLFHDFVMSSSTKVTERRFTWGLNVGFNTVTWDCLHMILCLAGIQTLASIRSVSRRFRDAATRIIVTETIGPFLPLHGAEMNPFGRITGFKLGGGCDVPLLGPALTSRRADMERPLAEFSGFMGGGGPACLLTRIPFLAGDTDFHVTTYTVTFFGVDEARVADNYMSVKPVIQIYETDKTLPAALRDVNGVFRVGPYILDVRRPFAEITSAIASMLRQWCRSGGQKSCVHYNEENVKWQKLIKLRQRFHRRALYKFPIMTMNSRCVHAGVPATVSSAN